MQLPIRNRFFKKKLFFIDGMLIHVSNLVLGRDKALGKSSELISKFATVSVNGLPIKAAC